MSDQSLSLKTINFNINPPSPYISDSFKRELALIGGLTDSGKPRYRIVWGPDQKVFAYGEQRLKYLQSSRRVPVGWEVIQNGERTVLPVEAANDPQYPIGRLVYKWLDKGKPFFYLEEWCPPEKACDQWELARWDVDPTKYLSDENRMIDVLGPAPREGIYITVMPLQDNDGNMLYPNEKTLQFVRRAIRIKEEHPVLKNLNWNEKPKPEIVEQYIRQKYQEMYDAEAREEERLVEVFESAMAPHAHRLNGVTNPGNGYIIIR